ncbi:MAG TPA: riboflavin synthase [Acidimicrobiia bacterium]|jgi:riboflavin synthase
MFTGIVEELGTVRAITPNEGGARIEIEARTVLDDAELGASIAVNGCCLTVVAFDADAGWWAADAVVETITRTNLGALTPGARVNLERPMRLGDRLGGHLVQGHVDGTGTVSATRPLDDGSCLVSVTTTPEVMRYVVQKGSITIDGVSLTVTEVTPTLLSVALIPHTQEVTTLGHATPGTVVNLEIDVVAKYVERLVGSGET